MAGGGFDHSRSDVYSFVQVAKFDPSVGIGVPGKIESSECSALVESRMGSPVGVVETRKR